MCFLAFSWYAKGEIFDFVYNHENVEGVFYVYLSQKQTDSFANESQHSSQVYSTQSCDFFSDRRYI